MKHIKILTVEYDEHMLFTSPEGAGYRIKKHDKPKVQVFVKGDKSYDVAKKQELLDVTVDGVWGEESKLAQIKMDKLLKDTTPTYVKPKTSKVDTPKNDDLEVDSWIPIPSKYQSDKRGIPRINTIEDGVGTTYYLLTLKNKTKVAVSEEEFKRRQKTWKAK